MADPLLPSSPRAKPAPRRRKRAPGPPREARARSVRPRRPRRSGKRALLVAAGACLGVVALAAAALLIGFGHAAGPGGSGFVEIDWPLAADSRAAARLLAERGLVRSEEAMRIYLDATGGTESFVAGAHLVPRQASPYDLRRLLSRDAGRPTAKLVVPEGFHRFSIGARLEQIGVAGKAAFLRASTDARLLDELGVERAGAVPAESAEGYLFPATYELPLDSEARDVVKRLVQEGDRRWQTVAAKHAPSLAALKVSLGWGRREVVTLASVVEKETAIASERPLIASVFLNRLREPSFPSRRLQSDPTSAYGCVAYPDDAPSCAAFAGKPTPPINQDPKNRYSTYTHAGLPPGPIANPGSASLEAVLAPAVTTNFYFVANGAGGHTFSETLEAHNDAVKKLRAAAAAAPAEAAGKTP